jgi:hypothetical protein
VDAIPSAQDHIAMYKRIGTGVFLVMSCIFNAFRCFRFVVAAMPGSLYLTFPRAIAGTNRPRRAGTRARPSKRLGQKAQHLHLEGPISHRQHVIPPRDVERPP